jgi:hypothetical protein
LSLFLVCSRFRLFSFFCFVLFFDEFIRRMLALLLFVVASLSQQVPRSFSAPKRGTFVHPGIGDRRGPCPGLNTLANHGFINRNGSDIDPRDLINAIKDAYNVAESASLIGVLAAPLHLVTLHTPLPADFDFWSVPSWVTFFRDFSWDNV